LFLLGNFGFHDFILLYVLPEKTATNVLTEKTVDEIQTILPADSDKASGRTCWRLLMTWSAQMPYSTEGLPASTLRTEPAENEFTFAKNPLAQGARARPGHVVPLHILNIAAAVADKVVVPHAFRIEARGATLDGHFPHQTRLHQVAKIVVSRTP
jgi:hypothetical protein